MSKANDFYALLTSKIVAAMKTSGSNWMKPWTSSGGSPVNVVTGKAYQGGNRLMFGFSGHTSRFWGTYRQWEQVGGQVRLGEKATVGIIWRPTERMVDGVPTKSVFASTFSSFNADQVDGWTEPVGPVLNADERHDEMDAFFDAIGATVVEGGSSAYYHLVTDDIHVPAFEDFDSSVAFYSTLAHEHGHWTGAKSRLGRDMSGDRSSGSYAREELVAELTSMFLLSDFGLSAEPRKDHAQYLNNWLGALQGDEKLIYTAARDAEKAATYLHEMAETVSTVQEPAAAAA